MLRIYFRRFTKAVLWFMGGSVLLVLISVSYTHLTLPTILLV